MPSIDDLEIRIAVVTKNGNRLFFENLVESLRISEPRGELAQRLSLSVQNKKLESGSRIAKHLANGAEIRYYAGHKRPLEEQFRGRIFANRSSWGDGTRHEITAYDPLYYFTQSEDDRYYPEGKTGEAILRDLARAWGIPVGKLKGPNEKLAKKAYRGVPIGDMVTGVLRETRRKGGGRWLVRMEGGKLVTVRRASNKRPFRFEAEDVSGLQIARSIENLRTVAKIVGRNKQGSKTLGRATGLTEFGTLQTIINRSDYNSPAGTRRAAIQVIKDEGKEIRTRTFAAPEIPGVRRGDLVLVPAGPLDGRYIVSSIEHDPLARLMFIEAEDPSENELEIDFEATGLYTWEPPKDSSNGHSGPSGERSASGWQWPCGGPVTSDYGPREGGTHYGIDIGASTGTAVNPGKPGRVTVAGAVSGYGLVVYVDHGNGYSSRYAHLSRMDVRAGERLEYGSRLGSVGQTGNATGPHLHFEIRVGANAVNPESYLP